MSNPTISFRLPEYHLARALWIIRQLEPNYTLVSSSHIVKTCFFDYLAKMNLARSNEVPAEIVIELNEFLASRGQSQELSLDDIIEMNESYKHQPKHHSQPSNEQSEISSVSDFSPPSEWIDDNEDES